MKEPCQKMMRSLIYQSKIEITSKKIVYRKYKFYLQVIFLRQNVSDVIINAFTILKVYSNYFNTLDNILILYKSSVD